MIGRANGFKANPFILQPSAEQVADANLQPN